MNNVAFLEGAEYAEATRNLWPTVKELKEYAAENPIEVVKSPYDDPDRMTQAAILERVRRGATTAADADQLFRWLNPTTQERIVKAYLCLMCEASAALQFIARDLREGLAQELLRDENLSSDPEVRSA